MPVYCSGVCYHAWRRAHRVVVSRPAATCHPGRPELSLGLCSTCYSRKHRSENKERYQQASRAYAIRRTHGITPAEYDRRVEALRRASQRAFTCGQCRVTIAIERHPSKALPKFCCRPCVDAFRRAARLLPPTCHPDRPRVARGLCAICYERERSKTCPKKELTPEERLRRLCKKYGITPADYARMLAEQHGGCAICRHCPDRTLHVDHCHATGKVRGLLCGRCNVALGMVGESSVRLRQAIDYLERHA